MPTRVVLDTNQLIAALTRPPQLATFLMSWESRRFTVIASKELLEEYDYVLQYPEIAALIEPELLRTYRTHLFDEIEHTDLPDIPQLCRDPDADFLGQRVNLPKLSPSQISIASKLTIVPGSYLLNYHHFSLAIHSKRRLPFFTAVNIDGKQSRRLRREDDSWHFDLRIPREHQIGHGLYDGNELDYGHLVRRLDPAWGSDLSVAKLANDDTFHFTNCAPQHAGFNRNKMTWAGLEDYLLKSAITMNLRGFAFLPDRF